MGSKFTLKIVDHIGAPETKKYYNEQHFSEAAPRYDFATRAMSLGRDGAWKRKLIAALPQIEAPRCLDLACGTGDLSFLLAEKYPEGKVAGLDLTLPMLDVARRRNRFANVDFTKGDMCQTGLAEASLDIVTGGYAVRNAPDLNQAFAEIYRILKPGGILALLDFSKPPGPRTQALQYRLLKTWCGFWGLMLHGNPEIHAYIAASLQTYPDRLHLAELVLQQGFDIDLSRRFYFGMMELMILRKPCPAKEGDSTLLVQTGTGQANSWPE